MASESTRPVTRGGFSFTKIALIVLPVALALGGYYYYATNQIEKSVESVNYVRQLTGYLKRSKEGSLKLDPAFVDANQDLIADAPADAKSRIDPETIVFSVLPGNNADAQVQWKEFIDHLAKSTGKKVQFLPVDSYEEQLRLLREGQMHVTGFNTGFVPTAVNQAGFVPQFVMADADGKFGYEMEILVPAKSPVKTLAELKGQKITFTSAGSHSGFKAALILLRDEAKLLPGTDYTFTLSGGHEQSILGLAKNQYAAISVANDLLQSNVSKETIKPESFRSIYKSSKFPPACYGTCHKIDPALSKKIEAAFAQFDWKGTGLEKTYSANGFKKFVPIDYKADWKYIREIDDKLIRWGGDSPATPVAK